jgi:hypothetical protein
MVALEEALLTELLIAQYTTGAHVACMKQIAGGRRGGGVGGGGGKRPRQHEAEYLLFNVFR